MKRSILTPAALAAFIAIAACGGGDADEPAFETVDPYAADPAATTAPPAEMEMDTMQMERMPMDTMGRGMMTDTMMR